MRHRQVVVVRLISQAERIRVQIVTRAFFLDCLVVDAVSHLRRCALPRVDSERLDASWDVVVPARLHVLPVCRPLQRSLIRRLVRPIASHGRPSCPVLVRRERRVQ